MSIFSKRPRRGVVICGAYGLENAGDDAVLTAILQDLRRLDKTLPITVMARKPASTAQRFGIAAVHPLNLFHWLSTMRRSTLFISGGGSLLQDVTSRRSLWYYLLTLALAKKMGCAVQLYGCGIGPLTREDSKARTAKILNSCADVITLRDEDSLELLRSLGVMKPRMLLASDPAIRLDAPPGEREHSFGIAVRPWPDFWARVPDFTAAARHVWETYKLPAVLICLAPEDHLAARSLCAALKTDNIPCSISMHPRRLGHMSLVLSMRLHGLIFAMRDGAPAAGVSYDPKVSAFCKEAGLPCMDLVDVTAVTLCSLVDKALHLDTEELSTAAEKLRQRERINARTAAEFI